MSCFDLTHAARDEEQGRAASARGCTELKRGPGFEKIRDELPRCPDPIWRMLPVMRSRDGRPLREGVPN